MVELIIALMVLTVIAVVAAAGVCTVSQGEEWVIERFGKYHRVLPSGLSFIIPFFDQAAYKVVTKDIVLDIPQQEVITSDNAVIMGNAVAFIKIIEPKKCAYGVVNYENGTRNLVQTALRSIIGEMTLDESLSSRETIKTKLKKMVEPGLLEWGIDLKTVEIQDIKPSDSMQAAMEQQAAAERERKAMVTRAEGEKKSAILESEGRLEAAKNDASAEVALATGSKEALQQVAAMLNDKELTMNYLLGQRYVEALQQMGNSQNSKFMLLPADLQECIRAITRKFGTN